MLTDIKLVLLCIVTTLPLYCSKYSVLNHPVDHLSLGHKQVKSTEKACLKRIWYWIFQKRSTEIVTVENNQNLSGIPIVILWFSLVLYF